MSDSLAQTNAFLKNESYQSLSNLINKRKNYKLVIQDEKLAKHSLDEIIEWKFIPPMTQSLGAYGKMESNPLSTISNALYVI